MEYLIDLYQPFINPAFVIHLYPTDIPFDLPDVLPARILVLYNIGFSKYAATPLDLKNA